MRITQHKTPKEEREIKPVKDADESKPSSRYVDILEVTIRIAISPLFHQERRTFNRSINKENTIKARVRGDPRDSNCM